MYLVASRHSSRLTHFKAYDAAYNATLTQAVMYINRIKEHAVPASLIVTFKESNVFVSIINKNTDKLLNWWVLTPTPQY